MCIARPICFRLLEHCDRAAAVRTFWTAGTSIPIRMAMMAITTSSSISVKADRARRERTMPDSSQSKEKDFDRAEFFRGKCWVLQSAWGQDSRLAGNVHGQCRGEEGRRRTVWLGRSLGHDIGG